MSITEPVTLLTDYILALAGLAFAVSLCRGGVENRSTLFWVMGFFAGAIAAGVGGTFHGFALYLSEGARRSLWNATLVAIGASAAFMVSAAILGPRTRWLKRGLALSIAGLLIQATGYRHGSNFNHNDVFHVIQTVALYFFYRGARLPS